MSRFRFSLGHLLAFVAFAGWSCATIKRPIDGGIMLPVASLVACLAGFKLRRVFWGGFFAGSLGYLVWFHTDAVFHRVVWELYTDKLAYFERYGIFCGDPSVVSIGFQCLVGVASGSGACRLTPGVAASSVEQASTGRASGTRR